MKFFDILIQTFPTFTKAMLITVEVTILSLFFATVLGVIFCLFKMSKFKPLQWISNIYISIIRGTPLLVQVLFIFFGIPMVIKQVTGNNFIWDFMVVGVVIMSLNAGAYMTELIRGGIEAIDKGQTEAARSLGLSYGQAMRKIILPQAFRTMLPSIINQFIVTLKDTSLLSFFGLRELVQNTRIIVANNMEYFIMYAIVGLYYWVIVTILSTAAKIIEKRTTYGK